MLKEDTMNETVGYHYADFYFLWFMILDDLMDDLDGDYGGSDISPVSGVEDCGPFKKVLKIFF